MQNNDLNNTARDTIEKFRRDLHGVVFRGEPVAANIGGVVGQNSGAVSVLIEQHRDVLDQLAAKCVEQYRWVNQYALIPSWIHTREWELYTKSQLQALLQFCDQRLHALLPAYESNGLKHDGYLDILRRHHEDVETNVVLMLRTARAEQKRATARMGLSLLERVFWLAVGAVISAVVLSIRPPH